MSKIVKLILICQIKDEIIPQLIPLYWIFSILVVFLLILIMIKIYFLFYNIIVEVEYVKIEKGLIIWWW